MNYMSNQIVQSIVSIVASLAITVSGLFAPKSHIATSHTPLNMQEVLGVATQSAALQFNVNVPAVFNDTATFNKNITAPNIVTSVQGKTGNLALTAGTGITLDGLTITNSNTGSAQNIFKNVTVGSTSFAAGSNTDTLTFAASGGTSVSIDTSNKKVTFSSTSPDYTQGGWTVSGTSVYPTTLTNNIGIGTASPTTPLYVLGASTLAGNVTIGGASTHSVTFTGRIKNGTSILPDTDLGSDLGASGSRFNNLWVANINSNSSQSFSGQTTFSYAPTNTTISQASVLINPTTSVASGQLLGFGIAGYQRALIDAEGDMILGYNGTTSAPATNYPLTIYGHNATNVAYVDTSGNLALAGGAVVKPLTDSTSALNIANSSGTSFVTFDTTNSRVGIGTTSPAVKLDLNSSSSDTTINIRNTLSTGQPQIQLIGDSSTALIYKNNSGTTSWGGANALNFYSGASSAIAFQPGGSPTDANTLYLSGTGGLVGVGTISPLARLDVEKGNGGNAAMIVNNPLSGDIFTASASGTPKFVIANNGNVGIGTTGPSQKLDVQGALNLTGNITGGDKSLVLSYATLDLLSSGGVVHQVYGNSADINFFNGGGTPRRFSTGGQSNNPVLGIASGVNAFLVNQPTVVLGNTNSTNGDFRITGGNVGIGTTNPIAGLDVEKGNGGNAAMIVNNPLSGDIFTASASGTPKFVIANNGNVGIGTTSPQSTLQLGSGQILLPSGSVSNPSFAFSNAANTGMYLPGSGVLGLTTAGSDRLTIGFTGNVGVGTTAPTSLLHVNGAVTGKALMNLNETGDQALLTASASGITKLTIAHNGLINATAGGISTLVNAGVVSDASFSDTAVNGTMALDSTDGRLYFRYGGVWHYVAQTAGFQIPSPEAYSFSFGRSDGTYTLGAFDTAKPLSDGDFLIPFVEKHLSDGGIHGLYTSFSEAKPLLFATENSKIASLSAQLAGIQSTSITYATATDLAATNTLMTTIQTTLTTLTNQVSALATTIASLVTRVTNLENQTQTGVVTIPNGKKGITVTFAHAFSTSPLVVVSGATLPHYTLSATTASFTLTFDSTLGSDTAVSWIAIIPTTGTTSTSFDSAPTPAPTIPVTAPTQSPAPSTVPTLTGTPSVSPPASPSATPTPTGLPTPTPSPTPGITPSPAP